MKFNYIYKFTIAAAISFAAGFNNSQAALLQLTHNPLFLDQSVPPAIAVTFDDSGSMQRSWIAPSSSFPRNSKAFASPDSNKIYYNPDILYPPPLNADGTQFPDSTPGSAILDGYYAYNDFSDSSRTVNLNTDYIPIFELDYERDDDVRFQFARTAGQVGLSNVRTNNFFNNYPTRQQISRDNNTNNVGVPAFYYRWIGDANASLADQQATNADTDWELVQVPTEQMNNFANWYTYYNSRNKLARSAISRAFSGFGPDFKIAWQELNDQTTFSNLDEFSGAQRTAFFNWLFTTPTEGGTPLRNAFNRAGNIFEQEDTYKSEIGRILTCQQNFHIAISDGQWNQNFTGTLLQDENTGGPIPGDVEGRYGNYDGSGESAIYPQADNGSSLADIAYHYWANDLRPDMTNNVRRYKGNFTNANGDEITFPAGTDQWDSPEFHWNPVNDPAYWQHMVTYNVGLGIDSSLVAACRANANCPPPDAGTTDPKAYVFRQLRLGNLDWGDAIPGGEGNARKFDDVWHSSINSRGDFFSAQNPQELAQALADVVNNIIERLSRGSASSVSSGVVTADTTAFSPSFDSSTWSGFLTARRVNTGGEFGEVLWEASCALNGGYCAATGETVAQNTSRNIYTYDRASNSTTNFMGSLSGAAAARFAAASEELRNRTGVTIEELVDYIRGDRSNEVINGGTLRDRSSILADIVHASAVIIRGAKESYRDVLWPEGSDEALAAESGNGYFEFKEANLNRSNIVLVGGNSGMMHAFATQGPDAGQELWGFIPSKALQNIHRLADPIFEHWSFVDNTPLLRDAFFGNSWHTMAVSGMRYGAQGYFALDVTNTTATQPNVLWEFTDEDDPDMGFTYGKPTVARLTSTGEWVVLLPNGYNNSELDFPDDPTNPGNILGSGTAVLYVVRARDGQLLAKINTGVGSPETPNGMATAFDVDSRFITPPGESEPRIDIGMDLAYAGDLFGNLYRIDFTSPNPSDWEASVVKVIDSGAVKERPITVRPTIVENPLSTGPEDNLMVIAGTGKYIELPDRSASGTGTQYVFGFKDGLGSSNQDISIFDGGFIEQTFTTSGNLRTLSSNNVDLTDPGVLGWRIELPEQGERMVNEASLVGRNLILFFSIIPGGDDPCLSGGRSWLLAASPFTGGTPNAGNIFTDDVVVGVDPDGNPITIIDTGTGISFADLIIGSPPIVENQGGGSASIIVEGTNTGGGDDTISPVELRKFTWRRRNWTNLLTQ